MLIEFYEELQVYIDDEHLADCTIVIVHKEDRTQRKVQSLDAAHKDHCGYHRCIQSYCVRCLSHEVEASAQTKH